MGIKFNGGMEITIKDLIWLLVVVCSIVWGVAVMPQKTMADCDVRFARKERVDILSEDVSYIRGRVDRMFELMNAR